MWQVWLSLLKAEESSRQTQASYEKRTLRHFPKVSETSGKAHAPIWKGKGWHTGEDDCELAISLSIKMKTTGFPSRLNLRG